MTRADAILAAIKAALSRRQLEGGELRAVFIEIHVKAHGGRPRCVVIRPEYEELIEEQLFANGASALSNSLTRPVPVGPPSLVST